MKKLDRTLGLFSAITISVGTMIGSAIFVLAGTSYEVAGPSASLAVLLAGLAAFPTAFSFCELVTIIPRAGGGYAYARDASDNGVIAFITGWGFWLAYAMSCGLFAIGFGNFLNYFFPFIPVGLGAGLLVFYVMVTNIKGIENTGTLQNVITSAMIILLFGYMIYASFFVDLSYQRPFFTEGLGGMFTAMGFLYITYIGYGLVTTASEEIVDPEKIIPRAIIISLVLVTFIKAAVFFLGSSIIRWDFLIPGVTSTPMTDTAIRMAGRLGGGLFAFAGIFATVSSINTAMMAAARTSFAMARDNHLPSIFKNINRRTRTPVFSVLVAAFIVAVSIAIRNLDHIATVTSLFALTGYSFVNVALMVFRKKMPQAKRAYRVPFYPFTPIAGIAVNIFLVFRLMLSNVVALSIAFGITLVGVLYYYFLIPKLRKAPKAMSVLPVPFVQAKAHDVEKTHKVLVPVASPATVEALIDISVKIVACCDGNVQPIHITQVPEIIPFDSHYDDLLGANSGQKEVLDHVTEIADGNDLIAEPLLILARHINESLKKAVVDTGSNLIIMGWHPSGFAYRMRHGIVCWALEETPADIGIFKKGENKKISRILYPYGGGIHSQATAQIIRRIALATGAHITFLHIVEHQTPEEEIEKISKTMREGLDELDLRGEGRIIESHSMVQAIIKESADHDLLVMGMSSSWGMKGYVTGGKSDKIMEKITCSGLVIRKYTPFMKRKISRLIFSNFKEHISE